jgi:hypothetical protein
LGFEIDFFLFGTSRSQLTAAGGQGRIQAVERHGMFQIAKLSIGSMARSWDVCVASNLLVFIAGYMWFEARPKNQF